MDYRANLGPGRVNSRVKMPFAGRGGLMRCASTVKAHHDMRNIRKRFRRHSGGCDEHPGPIAHAGITRRPLIEACACERAHDARQRVARFVNRPAHRRKSS